LSRIINWFIGLSVLLGNAIAADVSTSCRYANQTSLGSLGSLEKSITSCGLQTGLLNIEGVKEDHRKKIYEKLAYSLALQIGQNSEELALLTSFFLTNHKDLLMNDSSIKNQCRLTQLTNIESCAGHPPSPFRAMKLELLKNKLRGSGNLSKFDDNLSGILANKYVHNLGLSTSDESLFKCPLDESSGSFILQSQIDERYKANKNISKCIVSFSFVNNDMRCIFREKFPSSKWILLDTSDEIVSLRISQRKGHFYDGEVVDKMKNIHMYNTYKVDNLESNFEAIDYDHFIINGEDPIEFNVNKILKINRIKLLEFHLNVFVDPS
jgi:hypothetical protein